MNEQVPISTDSSEDYGARLNMEGRRDVWHGNHAKIDYVLRRAMPHLNPGMQVTEFGVGDAYLLTHLVKSGMKCIGADISSYLVNWHSEHLARQNPSVRFLCMDIADRRGYRFDAQDAVFCLDVLEHVGEEEYRQAIHNIHGCLRAGGVFVGSVPYCENLDAGMVRCPQCGHAFHRIGHKQSFDTSKLTDSLQPMFTIMELGIVNPPTGQLGLCRSTVRGLRYRVRGFRPGDTAYFIAERS
jgi:2-polyprenyl-3-methyl-5-hydroxy-6-metoxy-1,4-benzoquinol methylase